MGEVMGTIVGVAAAIISVGAYLPQVIKIYRRKSARDVSPLMFLAASVGATLWTTYGFHIGSTEICFSNMSILLLSIIGLILMAKYK